jgi:hypothetical protein
MDTVEKPSDSGRLYYAIGKNYYNVAHFHGSAWTTAMFHTDPEAIYGTLAVARIRHSKQHATAGQAMVSLWFDYQ